MSEQAAALKYINTGDNYAYPNDHGFQSGGRGIGGGRLKRGVIWALSNRATSVTVNPNPNAGQGGQNTAVTTATAISIDPYVYKRFQYNPAEVAFDTAAVATDPSSTEQQDGNLSGIQMGMGQLRMSIQLMFTRDQEVFAATNGYGMPGVINDKKTLDVYARVGVQKDIYDLYRVLIASHADINADTTTQSQADDATQTLPEDMTVTGLTKKAFDLATAGSYLIMKPVAVQTSQDSIFYGFITSLNVTYNKFNFNMVPTWAKVNMGLDVMSARPSSSAPGSVFPVLSSGELPRLVVSDIAAGGTPSVGPVRGRIIST